MTTIIQDFLEARSQFHAEVQKAEGDTSCYNWNSVVAHMCDFQDAYSPEERTQLWDWFEAGMPAPNNERATC